MEQPHSEWLTLEDADARTALLAKAREFINTFLAVVKNSHLFGDDHVTTKNSRQNLQKSVMGYLREVGVLEIVVGVTGISILGEPIIEVEQPQKSPFYPLLSDNVAGIRILEGVSENELSILAKALSVDASVNIEDSASTILWDAELDHIQVVRRDLIESGDPDSTSKDSADTLLVDTLSENIESDRVIPRWIPNTSLVEEVDVEAELLRNIETTGGAREVISDDFESLRSALSHPPIRIGLPYARVILGALKGVKEKSQLENARTCLFSVILGLIERGEYANAILVLAHTRKFLKDEPDIPLFPVNMNGEFSAAWLQGLKRYESEGDELARLWRVTPDEVQQTVLDHAITDPIPEVLKVLAEHATMVGEKTTTLVRHYINKAPPNVAAYLIELAASVLGEAGAITAAKATQHDDPKMRRSALRALTKLNVQEALRRSGDMLMDSEKMIRREARKLFEEHGTDASFGILEEVIESPFFATLDTNEKADYFWTALKLDSTLGFSLVRNAAQPVGFLGSSTKRDASNAAILALGRLGDRAAENFIREQASVRLASRSRKEVCQRALVTLATAKARSGENSEESQFDD